MSVTWTPLLLARCRAQATPANPPPTMTTRAGAAARSRLIGEARGGREAADERRRRRVHDVGQPSDQQDGGRLGDVGDGGAQVSLEQAFVAPRQDVRLARAQGILGDRPDDLLEPLPRIGGAQPSRNLDRSPPFVAPDGRSANAGIATPHVPPASEPMDEARWPTGCTRATWATTLAVAVQLEMGCSGSA